MTTITALAEGVRRRQRRGFIEVCLILGLYVGYCLTRLIASDAAAPARQRAHQLKSFEGWFGLDFELSLNDVFARHEFVGVFGSYWYATTHYLITGFVLIWLYRRGHDSYSPARRALVAATLIALAFYLLAPTAPPRLVGGYVDVLEQFSWAGWWGGDASAPRGLGGTTNQLAAFPSLHAGWAVWVALVAHRYAERPGTLLLAWLYAATTTTVIIGTGNHWVLDAVIGWAVVLGPWAYYVGFERAPVSGEPAVASAMPD